MRARRYCWLAGGPSGPEWAPPRQSRRMMAAQGCQARATRRRPARREEVEARSSACLRGGRACAACYRRLLGGKSKQQYLDASARGAPHDQQLLMAEVPASCECTRDLHPSRCSARTCPLGSTGRSTRTSFSPRARVSSTPSARTVGAHTGSTSPTRWESLRPGATSNNTGAEVPELPGKPVTVVGAAYNKPPEGTQVTGVTAPLVGKPSARRSSR